jgi:adenosine deaminase
MAPPPRAFLTALLSCRSEFSLLKTEGLVPTRTLPQGLIAIRLAVSLALLTATLAAALPPAPTAKKAQAGSSPGEARTARYFESIRKDPNLLLAFLRDMPKGADLHNHLSGAIYAESLIDWAAEKGDCVDRKTLMLNPPPCGDDQPTVTTSNAFTDTTLYAAMIDAFSMRNWQLSGQSGHDHFFATFDKFSEATHGNTGRMLAETASRAASQHELYQELMLTPSSQALEDAIQKSGWDDDLAQLRTKLLINGMPQAVLAAGKFIDDSEASRNAALQCGTSQPDAGCQVQQRYLTQVLRGMPKEVVFAQILLGFELARFDSRFVGLNLVMPEDWYIPMRDFRLHMRMLEYLHGVYPNVHIALHAGELVQGLVPPEGISFHVRDSVERGHAERIGHGVDVMNETHPFELLREMSTRNVMVEICLTSNDVILGVRGRQHPLSQYIKAGVPVALATDDEGVARSDMTHEYLKAAEEQDLSYIQLKNMARTSLEHAFLSGPSLWSNSRILAMAKDCSNQRSAPQQPSAACRSFLEKSEKARLQWELESQFRQFESRASTRAATPK